VVDITHDQRRDRTFQMVQMQTTYEYSHGMWLVSMS